MDWWYWSMTQLHSRPGLIQPLATFGNNPPPNIPSIRQLRITDTVHRIPWHLIRHPQTSIQLIQIPDSLTGRIQLVPSIRNEHSHPDKRNRFCRDSSNALGGYSLGSGGEAVAES
jgi:hypothetical protein